MPFNGSGTFVPLAAPDFPAVAGDLIEANKFNNNMLDVFNEGLTKCITRSGESPATGNLPMAGFRHTGVGNAVSATDYAAWGQTMGLRGAIGTADWDTLTTTGMYEATAASLTGASSHYPSTSNIGQLFVINQGAVIVHTYVHRDGTASRAKVSGTWSNWSLLETIAANTTLSVPSVYATVQDALTYLATKVILPGIVVTISIAAGTVTTATEITLNHPNGENIQIVGAGKTTTILARSASGNVMKVSSGRRLGLLKNLTLQGSNVSTDTGLRIDGGAVDAVEAIKVTTCANNILIDNGGRLSAVNGVCTLTSGSSGIVLSKNSQAYISTASQELNNVTAGEGSFVYLNTDITSGSATYRILGDTGATIAVAFNSLTVSGATNSGVKLANRAKLVLPSGVVLTSSSNGLYGFEYNGAERISGSISGSGNGTALESPAMYFGQSGDDVKIGSSDDIKLTPGTGKNILMGTHSALAAETVTGYITIKDAGGTLRKLAVVS